MPAEREKRNISPLLLRYLLSRETRRSCLGKYRNIRVTEQDDDVRYYAFEADSRDGRIKLKEDLFLSETAKPLFVRHRITGAFSQVDATSYTDIETSLQVKELMGGFFDREHGKYGLEYLFSARCHLQKERDGIHWIYGTSGEIDKVEVRLDPNLKITFFNADSQEGFIVILDGLDVSKKNYSTASSNNNGSTLVEVKREEGITIIGGCISEIDPLQYYLGLNQDGRMWQSVFVYNPTRFSFSGTVERDRS